MCYTVNNKKPKEEIAVKIKKKVLTDDEDLMEAHTIKKISPKNADIFSSKIIKEYEYPELSFYD